MPRTAWRQLKRVRVADPYFEWGRRTGFRYFSGGAAPEDFPVIMELAIPADKFARGDWERPPPKDWRRLIQVPSTYRNPPPGLEAASFCTASVRQDFFDRLPREPALNATILNVELALRVEPGVEIARTLAPTVWPAGAVVTGVIDDGLGFAHERLRLGAEPRMEFLWNQDGPTKPPIGFAYGLELQKQDTLVDGMKKQMADNTFAGLVDEDEVYRLTRHLQYERLGHKPLAARASHGTHVMDVACGFDPATVSDKRPLIGVQLPVKTTADTSGGSLGHYVLDGMRYILRRTTKVPTVVNVSYALIAGPHDGRSVLERSIDQLIALREAAKLPFAVVLPAGNHFLSRCHARFKTSSAGRRMRWRVVPDDPTPSFLELWLPRTPAGAKVRIRVRTPTGDVSQWITQGGVWTWQPAAQVLCEVVYQVAPAPGISRNMILIAIAPTTTDDPTAEVAPAGTWEIEVRRDGVASVVDAWIQRDDTAFGYPTRGRQSRFEDENYERFDESGRELELDNPQSYVKRDGTINPIATGRRTVVIGGIHYQDWRAAKYSAGGPVIRPARNAPNPDGPDAMAISDGSPAHYGILAAGSRSGSTVAMSGTSVAAPQIARWIADQMATPGQPYDRQAVSQFAQAGVAAGYRTEANPPPGAKPKPPSRRSGGGRIEGPQVVDRKIER